MPREVLWLETEAVKQIGENYTERSFTMFTQQISDAQVQHDEIGGEFSIMERRGEKMLTRF
jgi:hypothetical protein